ncbi:hypothetical protein [Streptomyces sp. ISL-94]|uniref:hypothetical protein n=1 Tax=Streptomyces sp. ISL-94 TaxID=2819190 RepID=UPI001BE8B7EF|nr:hypothetical protein [Streptomyces sp. ISL-94]MBT2481972.1 hypothetical protein [Streptomyces sp. ISL-94]
MTTQDAGPRIPSYLYGMEEQEHASGTVRSARRGTTLAALGGALIGALTGLAGSVLLYVQADKTQRTTSQARQADVRRAAYAGLGTNFQTFKSEIQGVRNYVTAPVSTQEEREHQYNDRYIPAYAKLTQAEVTVRLVGTDSGKQAMARSVTLRENLRDMVAAAFTATTLDNLKFTKEFNVALMKYEQAINAILDKATEEVL